MIKMELIKWAEKQNQDKLPLWLVACQHEKCPDDILVDQGSFTLKHIEDYCNMSFIERKKYKFCIFTPEFDQFYAQWCDGFFKLNKKKTKKGKK